VSASPTDPLIELAERIASVAADLSIPTALIGAMALAAHNYVRGTADIDLATAVDPNTQLRLLQSKLDSLGLHTELNLPDADDSLGGLLRVWAGDAEDDPVEIVNFYNPYRPTRNPGGEAIRAAVPIDGQAGLRCVSLPHLIALKLYAGTRRDHADVVELLRRNPQADLDEIRAVCQTFGHAELIAELIREAQR
jgi:hypothetical protein